MRRLEPTEHGPLKRAEGSLFAPCRTGVRVNASSDIWAELEGRSAEQTADRACTQRPFVSRGHYRRQGFSQVSFDGNERARKIWRAIATLLGAAVGGVGVVQQFEGAAEAARIEAMQVGSSSAVGSSTALGSWRTEQLV